MNTVSRSSWGARSPVSTSGLPGPVEGVSVHWEGPPTDEDPHEKCDDQVRAIQRFHMDVRRWSDIAYNFVVCEHGSVFVGRGWAVRSAANGTDRANDRFHAVCFLGGQDDPFPTAAQAGIVAVVAEARRRYPQALSVRPHSYFKPTECPGSIIRAWLSTDPFMPAPSPRPPVPPVPTLEVEDVFVAGDGRNGWLVMAGARWWIQSPEELASLKSKHPYHEAPHLLKLIPIHPGSPAPA